VSNSSSFDDTVDSVTVGFSYNHPVSNLMHKLMLTFLSLSCFFRAKRCTLLWPPYGIGQAIIFLSSVLLSSYGRPA